MWAMVETPAALFAIREICAFPQVQALVMGTNDLVKELRAAMVPGRGPAAAAPRAALLGAREAGKTILDGVWNDVKDLDGFRAECVQGKRDGLRRQDADPPGAGRPVQRGVGAQSEDEIDHARRVVEAFEEAEAAGRASSTSTAAWSRTCTATSPRASSRPPRPSARRASPPYPVSRKRTATRLDAR